MITYDHPKGGVVRMNNAEAWRELLPGGRRVKLSEQEQKAWYERLRCDNARFAQPQSGGGRLERSTKPRSQAAGSTVSTVQASIRRLAGASATAGLKPLSIARTAAAPAFDGISTRAISIAVRSSA